MTFDVNAPNKCGIAKRNWFQFDGGLSKMKLSEKLYSYRKKAGMSQQELAEQLDVSRQTVSKWETGQGYPSIESLKLLAKLFDTTIDELVSDEDVEIKIKQEEKKNKATNILGWITLVISLALFGVAFGVKLYWMFVLAIIFAFATCVLFNLQFRNEHNTSKAKRITMQIFTFISMFIAIGGFICLCLGI